MVGRAHGVGGATDLGGQEASAQSGRFLWFWTARRFAEPSVANFLQDELDFVRPNDEGVRFFWRFGLPLSLIVVLLLANSLPCTPH